MASENTLGLAAMPPHKLVVQNIFDGQAKLLSLMYSLQDELELVDITFGTEHEARMAVNHRRRLAKWLNLFKLKHWNLASDFIFAKRLFDDEAEIAEYDETTMMAPVYSSGRWRLSLLSLPMEVQIEIFSYLVEPPSCKHYYYACVWHHRLLDVDSSSTNPATKTRLFEKSPAVSLLPDSHFWTLCHASRFAMQRAYSAWIDEMSVRPYCDHRVGPGLPGDGDNGSGVNHNTHSRRTLQGRRVVFRANPDSLLNQRFIQWTTGEGGNNVRTDGGGDDDEDDDDRAA